MLSLSSYDEKDIISFCLGSLDECKDTKVIGSISATNNCLWKKVGMHRVNLLFNAELMSAKSSTCVHVCVCVCV